MKPSGVLIEKRFDVEGGTELERSSLVMTPDTITGTFFGINGVMTGHNELRLPVQANDAISFQRTKSPRTRERIVRKYVERVEGTDRYILPYGGYLGDVVIGSVLEINSVTKV